jgi:hypothetical protein
MAQCLVKHGDNFTYTSQKFAFYAVCSVHLMAHDL